MPIIAPHNNEFACMNNKFCSICIQDIGDENLIFIDVVAKWPRLSHGTFIL